MTDTKGYVYGAGLVLRKLRLGKAAADWVSKLTGRKGDMLTSSEDREICCALRKSGSLCQVRYDHGLFFKHHITGGDWWRYFLRLVQTAHRTTPHIVAYHAVFERADACQFLELDLRRCMTILKRALKPRQLNNGGRAEPRRKSRSVYLAANVG